MLHSENPLRPEPVISVAEETTDERADDADEHGDDDATRILARHDRLGDRARDQARARSTR